MARTTFLQERNFSLHRNFGDGADHIATWLQMAFAGSYHADADLELLEILAGITIAFNWQGKTIGK